MNGQFLVAIHQPNFFPWLGFFDKLRRADAFILLDDVQFPRSSRGTWTNRAAVLIQGQKRWITAPVGKMGGLAPINQVRTAEGQNWRAKLAGTLRHSYARAPHFPEAWEIAEPLIMNPNGMLAGYNVAAIMELASRLGLDTGKIHLASRFEVSGTSTARLIALTLAAGGNGYLSGDGAQGYQQDFLFAEAGLELHRQEFVPARYPQWGGAGFTPGLSVLDALFNLGVKGVASLIQGRREHAHER